MAFQIDTNPFANQRSFADYERANQEFMLKKQLAAAELQKANAFDIEKVGQQAFIKASQGIPLSGPEAASLQYLDSKSQTIGFNPVTGALEQKPGLLDRAGIGAAIRPSAPQTSNYTSAPSQNFAEAMRPIAPGTGGGGDFLADVAPKANAPVNEYDLEYERLLANAPNPKARQDIVTTYAKSKLEMNADQSKNAGFADRMIESNPLIERYTPAALDNANVRVDRNLPNFISNRIVSKDYQQFSQAQRDFINAQLRRESGAVISPEEFKNAELQYFPQVGDSPEVLAQKRANRDNAERAMKRSAGPAYKAMPAPVLSNAPANGGLSAAEQAELESLRARFRK